MKTTSLIFYPGPPVEQLHTPQVQTAAHLALCLHPPTIQTAMCLSNVVSAVFCFAATESRLSQELTI